MHSVTSTDHEKLVGLWFPSLNAAATHCSKAIVGAATDYLRTVKVYIRQKLPQIIAETSTLNRTISTFDPKQDPWATAHVDARVEQPVDLASGIPVEIGKCRPFVPAGMPRAAALDQARIGRLTAGGEAVAAAGQPHCRVDLSQ